jgi:hypothetical protein
MSHVPFEEIKVNTRIRLAALWTAVMFCYVYGDYFALYIPGEAENLVNGNTLLNSPIKVFAASVLMSIPPLVIIASIMARASLARMLNIIFGFMYTAIMLLIVVTSLPISPEVSAYVFYALLESVFTVVIIRQALKWPKSVDAQNDIKDSR